MKILVFEEIPVNEFNKVGKLIEIIDKIELENNWKKRQKMLEFIELSKRVKGDVFAVMSILGGDLMKKFIIWMK